jgi:pimeloyl-ACP methyl ester carboxylesterase
MLASCILFIAAGMLLRRGLHRLILNGLRAPRMPHGKTPCSTEWVAQAMTLQGPGGKSLFAWFVAAPGKVPAPAVLLMHGWGVNASAMLPAVSPLHAAGYSVLLLDARCHGASDDEKFSSLPRFAEDIESGLDWLGAQPQVDSHRLAVIGHSVGAGAALLCATRRNDLSAVVSVSAFAHPREMMRRLLDEYRIPYAVLGWYVLRHVERVIGVRFTEIAPVTSMASLRCPVLLVHGQDDSVVPFSDARRLQNAALPAIVPCLAIGGGHDPRDALSAHLGQVVGFLQTALATEFSASTRMPEVRRTKPAEK